MSGFKRSLNLDIVLMPRRFLVIFCHFYLLCSAFAVFAVNDNVVRIFPDFSQFPCETYAWNKAKGDFKDVNVVPPLAKDGIKTSMRINAEFSGKGFQFYSITPLNGSIPGKCLKVTLWAKTTVPGYSWALKFKDAKGGEKFKGKKLEFPLKLKNTGWTKLSFNVPAAWPSPISISSIIGHNWNLKGRKGRGSLLIHGLTVVTDVSKVASDKLMSIDVKTGVERNVFTNNRKVSYFVSISSWLGGVRKGSLNWRVADVEGKKVLGRMVTLSIPGGLSRKIAFTPPKFGIYSMDVTLDIDGREPFRKKSGFSYIPAPHKYTRAEKLASPYGLNIHGGMLGVAYDAIAATGFVWIRDYAYQRDWMLRAKGNDGKYSGWPWYPKMDAKIKESGLLLMPCMMKWISDYTIKAGKNKPDSKWKRDLLHILMTFPDYPAWEIDNEYDLHYGRFEAKRGWRSYRRFHSDFAAALKFLYPDKLAVEQGNAGIYPERVKANVLSGAFKDIDVVNAHFYCGSNPPELAKKNFNTNGGDAPDRLVYDLLREFVKAADADGENRQAWITEFGWDTLSTHVVTEREQAAYLQRGYMLGLQAGIDKMFWYWNRDTKKKPSHFFDGCGIFNPKDEPKPASASMAALVHMLKAPVPVGMFELGPNSRGYIFRDRGKLVAAAFALRGDAPAPKATFQHGKLFDMYANPIAGKSVKLEITPAWIVGVSKRDDIYLQTAYDLDTPLFRNAVTGDSCRIALRVRNNRDSEINAKVKVTIPKGWRLVGKTPVIHVEPGKNAVFPIDVVVGGGDAAGADNSRVIIVVREPGVKKILSTEFKVVSPAGVRVSPLKGLPGETRLSAVIKNYSASVKTFIVTSSLPSTWSISPKSVVLKKMSPGEKRNVGFQLKWNGDYRGVSGAKLLVALSTGANVAESAIVPAFIKIPRVSKLKRDGKSSKWPVGSLIPGWMLGRTGDSPDASAEIGVGYVSDGLRFVFKVKGSKGKVGNPKRFWDYDCAEIFIDTKNDKIPRKGYAKRDHQFWICPMLATGTVYAGRWKRNSEISATRYDIKSIKGRSFKTSDGYVMEFTIPKSEISGFNPNLGGKFGLNVNLTIMGSGGKEEIFWPLSKADGVADNPAIWGTVELEK